MARISSATAPRTTSAANIREAQRLYDEAKSLPAGEAKRAGELAVAAIKLLVAEPAEHDTAERIGALAQLALLADPIDGDPIDKDAAGKAWQRRVNFTPKRGDRIPTASERVVFDVTPATSARASEASAAAPTTAPDESGRAPDEPLAAPETPARSDAAETPKAVTNGALSTAADNGGPPETDDRSPEQRRWDAEVAVREQTVERLLQELPADDPRVLEDQLKLAELQRLAGQIREAQARYAQVLKEYLALVRNNPRIKTDRRYWPTRDRLGLDALSNGDFGIASELLGEAADGYERSGPDDKQAFVAAKRGQAAAAAGLGDLARAQSHLETAAAAETPKSGENSDSLQRTLDLLLDVLRHRMAEAKRQADEGDHAAAAKTQDDVVAGFKLVPDATDDRLAALDFAAAQAQRRCQLEEALQHRRAILEILSSNSAREDETVAEAKRNVAALLRVMGRTAEARAIER